MPAESYFYLNEKEELCGPFTADQLRTMVAMEQLAPDTLVTLAESTDWVPLATVVSLAPTGLPGNYQPPRSSRKKRRSSTVIVLSFVAIVLAALGYGVWRWLPELKKMTSQEEEVVQSHPLARWYLFGYFQGRQQAKIEAAFGRTPGVNRADVAYCLKTLGVPDPGPQQFALCVEGFEDGVLNRPQRHALGKGVAPDDAFPDAMNGIFEFPVQEKKAVETKGK